MAAFAIRMAQDEDGGTIRDLVTGAGFSIDGLDWSKVYPYWLVAESLDKSSGGAGVVGCLQVHRALPIGRLEMLAANQALSDSQRAKAVKALVFHGMAMLAKAGAGLAMGVIPFELRAYTKILKRRGARIVNRGNIIAKRLT